nr:alpha/beta fold hydrolase [Pseudomonas sp. Leaf127]
MREAVVIDVEGPGGRQLAAYVVPMDLTVAENDKKNGQLCKVLRKHLKSGLADYMIPSHIVMMSHMPMTPNGKMDRKRLPDPDRGLETPGSALPRTRIERQLAAIWQEVLGRDHIGLNDDFFELGGHSILMLGVLRRVREQIDERFAMHDFMRHPTLEKQAELLRDCLGAKASSLIKLNSCPDEGAALFCLPPAGGTTFPYYALAKELNTVCPVYALLHKGFVEKGFHYPGWHDMVGHYFDEIVRLQPEGPYHLLGWSSGGALAMEVAHLLERKGEKVNLLALVDSMMPPALSQAHRQPIQEAAVPVDLAELDERNHAAVMMIRGFFPEKSDADIMHKVIEARTAGLQDDRFVRFMINELLGEQSADSPRFQLLYDAYALEAEFSVGYDIYGNISSLANDFELPALHVRPELWWSSVSYRHIDVLEASLVEACGLKGVQGSECLDVAHEAMIYAPAFLQSLKLRLRTYFNADKRA